MVMKPPATGVTAWADALAATRPFLINVLKSVKK
jgi:hypothetical protein